MFHLFEKKKHVSIFLSRDYMAWRTNERRNEQTSELPKLHDGVFRDPKINSPGVYFYSENESIVFLVWDSFIWY